MAELGNLRRIFGNIFSIFKSGHSVRNYAVYSPRYVEPVWESEEVEKQITKRDQIDIQSMLVKAAPSHATCSVFYDPDVQLFTNYLMRKGDRAKARSLVEKAFEKIKRIQLQKYYNAQPGEEHNIEINPREIFHEALQNVTPVLITKKVKRSGTWYEIPTVILPKRAKFVAMKYILESAAEKGKKDRFVDVLAKELLDAYENKGKSVQKKIDLHKFCVANRAYSHYRWA